MVDGQTSEVGERARKPVEVGSRKELDPAPNLNQLMEETTVQETKKIHETVTPTSLVLVRLYYP